MPITLRLCLFDRASEPSFQQAFTSLRDVEIVARCRAWHELEQTLLFGNVDAVAVNLDGEDDAPRLLTLERINEVGPDAPILGVGSDARPDAIIAAMRAGCAQFVPTPIDQSDLTAAIDRIRRQHVPTAEGCEHIAIVGSAGGAGSTTLSCNLALELARQTGRRTALIDMDLHFGDIACLFDRNPKYSVTDLCRPDVEIDRTLVEAALDELPCNVSLLARPESIELAYEVDPEAVEKLFRCLGNIFPFVVTDIPRHLSTANVRALQLAHRVFLVSQLAVPFLRNATRLYKMMLQAGVEEERISLILNRCNAEHERIRPEEVANHFGKPIFAIIPNDYKRVTAARDLGHPILVAAAKSPARLAIQNIAQQIATGHLGEAPPAAAAQSSGFLGLFRRKGKTATSST